MMVGNETREYYTWTRMAASATGGGKSRGLVVLLHVYGGNAEWVANFAGGALLDAGFDLVLPQGVASSWNAGECCGAAVAKRLRDDEFVAAAVQDSYSGFAALRGWSADCPRAIVAGFSNGAFLTTQIALRAVEGDPGFSWVVGAIAVSGFRMDSSVYERAKAKVARPIPVFLVTGEKDTLVNPSGCCGTTARSCCCGISQLVAKLGSQNKCVDAQSAFTWFSEMNCGSSTSPASVTAQSGISCTAFNSGECKAAAVWCSYPSGSHLLDARFKSDWRDLVCWMSSSSQAFPGSPPPDTEECGRIGDWGVSTVFRGCSGADTHDVSGPPAPVPTSPERLATTTPTGDASPTPTVAEQGVPPSLQRFDPAAGAPPTFPPSSRPRPASRAVNDAASFLLGVFAFFVFAAVLARVSKSAFRRGESGHASRHWELHPMPLAT